MAGENDSSHHRHGGAHGSGGSHGSDAHGHHGQPHGTVSHGLNDNDHGHGHSHGVVDPTIATTGRGIWAIKWSFVGLGVTGALQLVVVLLSGSVALLADTIHNFGDAFTAVPLWIAFLLVRRRPSKRFSYGLGRAEDLAGAVIVLVILASAALAAYESMDRLFNPRDIDLVWVVAAAGGIGFLGNEAVAMFRIRVGKEINSAALIADGQHARVDGLTSLSVLAGAIGVWAGFPMADPLVGLIISVAILKIVWDSGKSVFTRMLDGSDPDLVDQVAHAASHVSGVMGVSDVRARWLGHRLEAEVHIAVPAEMAVSEAHALSVEVSHRLSHEFPFLGNTVVHVDPADRAGAEYHRVTAHAHDGLPVHSH